MSDVLLTSSPAPTSARSAVARAVFPTAVVAFVAAAALSIHGAHSRAEWIVEVGAQIVAAGLLFGLAARLGLRRERTGGLAVVIGAVGLAAVFPAFWTGLPLLCGGTAVLLGLGGPHRRPGAALARVGLVLGALAVLGDAAIYVIDAVINH